MNHETPENRDPNDIDTAIADRLAAFGQRDVDVSRLEERIKTALGAEAAAPDQSEVDQAHQPLARLTWLRPVLGIAAMFVVAAALVFAFNFNPPQASANAIDLSQLHEDVAEGRLAMESVTALDEANRRIAAQIEFRQELPDRLRHAQVQSCCLTDVQGELLAVVLLEHQSQPLTLVVARAEEFGAQHGHRIEINGKSLHAHDKSGIPMVMANQGDRWLCVMGDLDYQQLAEVAAGVDF